MLSHIFMKCPFSLQFCNKIKCWLGKKDIQKYEYVELCLKIWFSWEYLNNDREITSLTSWNLWNYRNVVSFENCPPILHKFLLLCALWINIWMNNRRLRSIVIKHICFKSHMCFISHMRYNAYAFCIAYVL